MMNKIFRKIKEMYGCNKKKEGTIVIYHDKYATTKLDEENRERLDLLSDKIDNILGFHIPKRVFLVLAVKRFLDCYIEEPEEVIKVLQYYDFRIKGGSCNE